ncbi:MAG: PBSX family phage terminase large subunit, partial [Clostridia bacterium]|nr:PBSX family phage terminase large subunit [Clostridia bacterium]
EKLAGDKLIQSVIVDPSAASFIETIRRHGRFTVKKAKNTVLDGIRNTATYMSMERLIIHPVCEDAIREFGMYSWDDTCGEDKPIKENDHAMDDIRYFCNTILKRRWD